MTQALEKRLERIAEGRALPVPGEFVRDGESKQKVLVDAREQKRALALIGKAREEMNGAMHGFLRMAVELQPFVRERLYLQLGYTTKRECFEREFEEGVRTLYRVQKIVRAFVLEPARLEESAGLMALGPKKLEALSRLPEEAREALRMDGKFGVKISTEAMDPELREYFGDMPELVTLHALKKMTLAEVESLSLKIRAALRPLAGAEEGAKAQPPRAEKGFASAFRGYARHMGLALKAAGACRRLARREQDARLLRAAAQDMRGCGDRLGQTGREIARMLKERKK